MIRHPLSFVVAPLATLTVAFFLCAAAQSAEQSSLPNCQIERTTFDAGEVFAGQTVRCRFPVRNTGQGVLQMAVGTSCGCTVARFDAEIPPGGEGRIDADWKPTAAPGGRSLKTIEVTTNDPAHRRIQLTLQATVASTVRVLEGTEKPVRLSSVTPMTHEILVETRGVPPIGITGVSTSADYVTVAIHPPEARDDTTRVQKLTLTIQPSAPRGRSALTLLLATNASKDAVAEVRLVCEKGIAVSRERIVLRPSKPGAPPVAPVSITLSKQEGEFHVTRVETGDLALDVALHAVEEDQEYRLSLTALGGPTRRGTIRIYTDDPDQPVIDVAAFCLASR